MPKEMKTTMQTITSHAIALVVGMALVAAGCVWMKFKPSLDSVLGKPAEDLSGVGNETVPCQTVIVYKEKAKDKLGLPESVKADAQQKVLAATQVDASERPTTVSAVLDTGSGITSMYKRQDPYKWLAFNRRYEIGFDYVLKDGSFVFEPDVRAELMQIKALRLGVIGRLNSDGDFIPGARVWAIW